MAEPFDPYYKWLAVPPEDQPPDFYQLVGVHTFEADPDVIENAADQRMVHLRTFQSGKHSEESQKLLNEVAAAKIVLLNPEKKAKYDETLREQMRLKAAGEDDEEISSQLIGFLRAVELDKEAAAKPKPAVSQPVKQPATASAAADDAAKKRLMFIGAGTGVLLLLLIIGVWILVSGGGPEEVAGTPGTPKGQAPPPPPPTSPQPKATPSTPTPPSVDPDAASVPTSPPPLTRTPVDISQLPKGFTIDLGSDVKMEFVLIPPGEFMMGSTEAEQNAMLREAESGGAYGAVQSIPGEVQHRVKIAKPFYLGKYEVSQAQWQVVMEDESSEHRGPMSPVSVSWNDCQAFLSKLNEEFTTTAAKFALPTEAQWEYACRAGTATAFCFGDGPGMLGQYAWFRGNSTGKPHPVGKKKPNQWGLFDMHGNVWEWCGDWYGAEYYELSATHDPTGPPDGQRRVKRGGSWTRLPVENRSAARGSDPPVQRRKDAGFRVMCSGVPETAEPDVSPPIAAVTPPVPQPPTTEPTTPEPAPTPKKKLPVPSTTVQAPVSEQLEQIYNLSKLKVPSEKLKMAKELLNLARQPNTKPVEKFVLFRKATELATGGGDALFMLEVIDAMEADFRADVLRIKGQMLRAFAGNANTSTEKASLLEATKEYVAEAMAQERYDYALAAAKLTQEACKGSSSGTIRKGAIDLRDRVQRLADEQQKLKGALARLKANPADRAAHLLVGQIYCFTKNDWEAGLPHLAKGSDARLARMADVDAKSPTDTALQAKLADAWWDLAETRKGDEKDAMLVRAAYWYKKALPGIGGLAKAKTDKRLAEFARMGELMARLKELEAASKPVATPVKPPEQPSFPPSTVGTRPLPPERSGPFTVDKTGEGVTESVAASQTRALFNGKNLEGWVIMGKGRAVSAIDGGWTVDPSRGVLMCDEKKWNGVWSVDSFQDFILTLEWRWRPGHTAKPNGSGVVVRTNGFNSKGLDPKGIEIDLRPKKGAGTGAFLAYEVPLRNHEGAIDGFKERRLGCLRQADRNGDEWTPCEIECIGDEITVKINGTLVNRATNAPLAKGKIVLRNQFSGVEFRNIKLREVVKPPAAPARPPQTQSTLPKERSVDFGGGVKMEFVLIPAGEFVMGSPEAERQEMLEAAKARNLEWAIRMIPSEGPQHRVKISKPFYLGKYEVTQAQWQAVMSNNPSKFQDPMHPVEQVSWDDIQPFLAKLNMRFEKKEMRFGLPTEAQWEYACRAGTTTTFSFGDNPALFAQYGWYRDNSGGKTHPVGQRKPNAWGLYDMHGNVFEWCSDWYGKEYYRQSPAVDPTGPPTGSCRVFRGGCWRNLPQFARSAFRFAPLPSDRRYDLGFRVICTRTTPGTTPTTKPPAIPVRPPQTTSGATPVWTPLLDSPDKLAKWKPVAKTTSYEMEHTNGVVTLTGVGMVYPIEARDMIVRAKVKKTPEGNASLFLRHSKEGYYAACFFGSVGQNARFLVGKRTGPGPSGWQRLQVRPWPKATDGFFEFGFGAVGKTLRVYANGQPIIEVHDSSFSNGRPGFEAHQGCTAQFRDVEIQILKK